MRNGSPFDRIHDPMTIIADPVTKTIILDVGTLVVWSAEDARVLAEKILECVNEMEKE
jgi:predicted metal-binding membrane protein